MAHQRPEVLFPLFSALTDLPGIGPKTGAALEKVEITKPRDVLFTLPASGVDRRRRDTVLGAPLPGVVTVEVTVGTHVPPRARNRPYRVFVEDAKTEFELVFFHAHADWLQKMLPSGQRRLVSGKAELFDGRAQMAHPDYILRPEEADDLPLFEPVYPLTQGVTQKTMHKAAAGAVALAPELPDWIDPHLKTRRTWPDWHAAVAAAHAPDTGTDLSPEAPARQRLAYDELFVHQLTLALARAKARKRTGRSTKGTGDLADKVLASLPFSPTGAQRRAVSEILGDMASTFRMNRLLQGDVGSGKTLVALLSMLAAVEAGGQAALMALLLALSVNIGVGAMVSSFRATFLDWLDQRLAAELYIRGADETQAADMATFLNDRPEVQALLPIRSIELSREGYPYFLQGIRDDEMYRRNWPLLEAIDGAWDRVSDGTGVMISEQFSRAASLSVGDALVLGSTGSDWTPRIVGIYPDYGNPTGQAIISDTQLSARWSVPAPTRYAVRLAEGTTPQVVAALETRFALGPGQAVDQVSLKAISRQVFERTFAVTLALNVLTFAVAGLALLISLLTLAGMRLPQVAPMWALGLTRARLARLELARALMLALLTTILAIPLGVLVAWILLAVVNVEAFGWRIPLRHYPWQWLQLGALALLTAGLAAALPARRLGRTPPALLLRIFSDAR